MNNSENFNKLNNQLVEYKEKQRHMSMEIYELSRGATIYRNCLRGATQL
jgi:hypothetical protein